MSTTRRPEGEPLTHAQTDSVLEGEDAAFELLGLVVDGMDPGLARRADDERLEVLGLEQLVQARPLVAVAKQPADGRNVGLGDHPPDLRGGQLAPVVRRGVEDGVSCVWDLESGRQEVQITVGAFPDFARWRLSGDLRGTAMQTGIPGVQESCRAAWGSCLSARLPRVVMIRPFQDRDAAAVVALALRAWEPVHASLRLVMGDELFDLRHRPDWRAKQRRDVESVLADEDFTIWVAEEDGSIVGFVAATLRRDDDMGEIQMVAVDPPSQNKGIGTKLTEIATDWIRESGLAVAFISTGGEDTGHDAARATYEKAGYRRLPIAYYLKALRTETDDSGT